MNLMEVVMAALVFSVSAGSSLQIWTLMSAGVLQQEQRQRLADRLDGELAALEAMVRLQSRRQGTPVACEAGAAALRQWLLTRPLGDGVVRQVSPLPQEDGVLLQLTIAGSPGRRQRLFHPAALGLCLPAGALGGSQPGVPQPTVLQPTVPQPSEAGGQVHG